MDLRQLRYFAAVADTLNFSRAAESLYVSQSALSQQIAELERELGVRLFLRDKRSVELTEAGENVLREAKFLLIHADKLTAVAKNSGADIPPDKSLMVGFETRCFADPAFRLRVLDRVYRVRTEKPGSYILFRRNSYDGIRSALEQREIDLAFLISDGPMPGEGLVSQVLSTEEMMLVFRSSKVYPNTAESVRRVVERRGLILLDKDTHGLSQILRILDDLDLHPQIRFCDDKDAMTLTAESGESATILPQSVVRGLGDPNLQCLSLGTGNAALHLLAVRRSDSQNELIDAVLSGLADA